MKNLILRQNDVRIILSRGRDETALRTQPRLPTPGGSYNPDWAVLIDCEEGERLYFVVETKGSLLPNGLRGTESAKIECGKAHFNALKVGKSPARYEVATSVDELLAGIGAD